jgi:hypothetical protein
MLKYIVFIVSILISTVLFTLPESQKIVVTKKNIDISKFKTESIFINYQPLRQISSLGTVLSDVESHLPAGHIYRDSDMITWTHESSHGIASQLRGQYAQYGKYNGFYVLKNRACIIKEPNTTINKAARLVPNSLRGDVYNLYMVQQANSWNDSPLYILDEFIAYTNGSDCRLDLKIADRSESVKYMIEFGVYSMCLAQSCQSNDLQFKKFLMWSLERMMNIYQQSSKEDTSQYLTILRISSDAENLRRFSREYFGKEWTKNIIGF